MAVGPELIWDDVFGVCCHREIVAPSWKEYDRLSYIYIVRMNKDFSKSSEKIRHAS